jgi:hypothetical protein
MHEETEEARSVCNQTAFNGHQIFPLNLSIFEERKILNSLGIFIIGSFFNNI